MTAVRTQSRPVAAPAAREVAVPAPRRRFRTGPAAVLLSAVLVFSLAAATAVGPADISVADAFRSIGAHLGFGASPLSVLHDGIIWELRLPRVLTAAAVGAGLAVSGAVMQALTRNALADPYLLGLSSGASLGAVCVVLLGLQLLLPLAAFIGALAALAATLLLARLAGGLTPSRTVLAGVAVSSLGSALTSLVIFWTATGDSYRNILGWLLGALSGAQWSSAGIAAAALLVVGVPLLASSRILDGFAFGDDAASALGLNVPAVRWTMLAGTALLTGAMVSVSGAIGFIGLVFPHVVRLIAGPGHRSLLPLSALLGAIFLIWADTAARYAFEPRELPVGVVTAVIGAPVFAYVLARRKGGA